MRRIAVIPARLASKRYPGKLMASLEEKPVILRTLERVKQARNVDEIIVATDHDAIEDVVRQHSNAGDVRIVRSASEIENGTARVAHAVKSMIEPALFAKTLVLNIQADQPNLDPGHVDRLTIVAGEFCCDDTVATLCTPLRSVKDYCDPSVVKCVMSSSGHALYFSRAGIPFVRDGQDALQRTLTISHQGNDDAAGRAQCVLGSLRHLGMYAFTAELLVGRIMGMEPCAVERMEKLEQLRWMYHGVRLQVAVVPNASRSIDTPDDLRIASDELSR